LGVALVRPKLGAPWIENGTLVRLFEREVPSPHAHYLCWRTGAMDRWECASFAEWLKRVVK
jgi:LysR family transcriptional regulator, glycine cleavage system transcriptional activator